MPRLGLFEQFLDDNGDPLASGRLYFYEVGTTTPFTVYSDSGESVPISQPVTLGSDGRMPDVFYTGQAKLVIKDSADATVWTIETIGAESTSAADIRALYLSNEDTNAFTDAEQTKLAGIATDANLYVHPDHTGDVTSDGDGATTIQPNAIINKEQIDSIEDTDEYLVSDAGVLKRVDHSVIFEDVTEWDYSTLANGEYVGIHTVVPTTSLVWTLGEACIKNASATNGLSSVNVSFENTSDVFGVVTNTPAALNTNVLLRGFVRFTSWSWTPGAPLYATTGTTLTQTRPTTGYAVRVGIAMTSDIIYVDPQDPVGV